MNVFVFSLLFASVWYILGLVCLLVARHLWKKKAPKNEKHFNQQIAKILFVIGLICFIVGLGFTIYIFITLA